MHKITVLQFETTSTRSMKNGTKLRFIMRFDPWKTVKQLKPKKLSALKAQRNLWIHSTIWRLNDQKLPFRHANLRGLYEFNFAATPWFRRTIFAGNETKPIVFHLLKNMYDQLFWRKFICIKHVWASFIRQYEQQTILMLLYVHQPSLNIK